MTTQRRPRNFFLNSRAAETAFDLGRKAVALSLAYLMVPLGMGDLYAQQAPPPPPDQQQYSDQAPDQGPDQGPPPQAYNALSPDQLNQLVAPIALYPDALVAQILAASTYPNEVADADNFVHSNQGAPPDQLGQMADGMNWDPSVKALIAFPSVLDNLNKNLDWTSQLGNAYYNQPQDVMSAVQTMRQRAYQAGNLQTNQQIAVQYQPGNIVIAPANPTVVYVPYYNPWVVYGAPIAPWGGYYLAPRPVGYFGVGLALGFGVGIAIGSWNHWGWGWHNWGMGWGNRTVVYQRNVYISRSTRVVNHGYYGRFDRNVAARNYNRNMAARAPNYRPGGNFNRPGNNRSNNNFNRPGNNYNRPNNNARPNNNFNRPNNNFNRPNNNVRPNTPNNSRPNNNYRPSAPNNNRPANNYNRPNNNARPANNYNRPANNARPAGNTSRPQSQAHPQSRPQSRPASRPSNGGGRDRKSH